MSTLSSISRYVETTSFRLGDLVRRAGAAEVTDRALLEESLAELSTALAELRVSEEELRSQAESLADLRQTVEAELQRYRELFRLAPEPCLVTDADGVIRDLTGRKEAGGEAGAPSRPVRQTRDPGAGAAEWSRAFLAEAGKAVDASSRSAVAALAGLLRDSLAMALYLGHLREGDRLPGIREVARATGLNHKGVARAYRQLVAEGVLEVRDRSGVYVARQGWSEPAVPEDTARWLTEVLTGAWERRIGIPALPELIRRRTAAVRLRCACVESSAERRAPLCRELESTFGLDVYPVALEELPCGGRGAAVPAEALRDADLLVTTPFHAGGVRTLARELAKPLMVATSCAEGVDGAAERGAAPPLALSLESARGIAELLVRLNAAAVSVGSAAD